jgi:putative transcriptional regulator
LVSENNFGFIVLWPIRRAVMKTVRTKLVVSKPVAGRIDARRVDATTEADLKRQAAEDDAAGVQDAALYARRVRRRTGLTQADFASRLGVPVDTVRNWEQGKRLPAGPAKALLRILDKAPEAALSALS